MAANTALVVRQPAPAPPPLKRRTTNNKGKLGGRQIGMGVAGAMTSAAVAAGLCTWFGMKPQWAGAATGSLGAIGAFAAKGSSLRPFAAGAALGGGALALTSVLGHLSAPDKTDDKKGEKRQLDGGKPEVLAGPPGNTKDANPPLPRSAASVTDAMRDQIARAMQETRYRG